MAQAVPALPGELLTAVHMVSHILENLQNKSIPAYFEDAAAAALPATAVKMVGGMDR